MLLPQSDFPISLPQLSISLPQTYSSINMQHVRMKMWHWNLKNILFPVTMVKDEDYVCSLDEASLKKAREELNEIPQDRLAAVKALREWVLSQPHIKWPATGNGVCMLPQI